MVVSRFVVVALLLVGLAVPAQAGIFFDLTPSAATVDSGDIVTVVWSLNDPDGDVVPGLAGVAQQFIGSGSASAAITDTRQLLDASFFETFVPAPGGLGLSPGSLGGLSYATLGGIAVGGITPIAEIDFLITGAPGSTITITPTSFISGVEPAVLSSAVPGASLDAFLMASVPTVITVSGVIPEPQSMLVWCLMIITAVGFVQVRRLRARQVKELA